MRAGARSNRAPAPCFSGLRRTNATTSTPSGLAGPEFVAVGPSYLAMAGCSDAQYLHRLAASGMSLRHSEHFLSLGSTGASRLVRSISEFIGLMMKKKMIAAMIRK